MNFQVLDWIVLLLTLFGIILYGLFKSRSIKNIEGYFLSNRQLPWWLIMLGIMGTQASAITFLSAPGQAYTDGLRFIQYYFGLPLAVIVICIIFIPIYHKLKVYTAYQFLETRFDLKTRTLTSFLFLLSRGLSTGISIYAPSLVLSSMLGINIYITNLITGGLLIIYTVTGGAKAVAYTQQLQFIIIYSAIFIAGSYAIISLPSNISFTDALHIAGKSGKLNIITTAVSKNGFDWNDKYNILSGLIGGFFLALSYFGTDQSQVGRYLTAKDTRESRLGLLLTALIKIPLQFLILLIGCLVFAYYTFFQAPAFFNKSQEAVLLKSEYAQSYKKASIYYNQLQKQKSTLAFALAKTVKTKEETKLKHIREQLQLIEKNTIEVRGEIKKLIAKANPNADTNDTNYIFLRFVSDVLPTGLVGLIVSIIFLAAWGSIAAAIHSLASCTMMDFHQKFSKKQLSEAEEYWWSKFYTIAWGVCCMLVAFFAYNLGNSLIETVNILGSWFYGTILGIFIVAFFLNYVKGDAVFIAAIISETIVIAIYFLKIISFLWLNVIGTFLVILISLFIQRIIKPNKHHDVHLQ